MQTFDSDGVRIAFRDEGEGDPILLIHGFASNMTVNWVNPGWLAALTGAGRRVIAFDHRGHGASDKLYDSEAYRLPRMADDARRLLEHLAVGRTDLLGYSMGGRIAALVAAGAPDRVRSLVLGGVGMNLVTGMKEGAAIADALLADDPAAVTSEPGKSFRRFADRTKSDRRALAACIRSAREPIAAAELGRITAPALVTYGARDPLAASAAELATLLPQAGLLEIPERDHMTVVGDPRLIKGVVDFLARRP